MARFGRIADASPGLYRLRRSLAEIADRRRCIRDALEGEDVLLSDADDVAGLDGDHGPGLGRRGWRVGRC
jgi:hypothetical protein